MIEENLLGNPLMLSIFKQMIRNIWPFNTPIYTAYNKSISIALRLVSVIVIFITLEFLHAGDSSSFLPAPSNVAKALFAMYSDGLLVTSATESLLRVLYGFSAALLVALPIGYGLGRHQHFRDIVMLPLEILRPIPPIAWIPLAIIFFGISNLSAYFVIFIGAVFPLLTNTELGVKQVRSEFIEVARIYGASNANLFRHVVLPASLPSIFGGVIIGLGFSWMVVVAAEMVASDSGLGYQIQLDRQLLRLDRVIAGMVAIGVLGYVLISIVKVLEWYALPWLRVRETTEAARKDPIIDECISIADENKRFMFNVTGARLDIDELSFGYSPDRYVLTELALKVNSGVTVAILGESGSGKTTLLRLLAGLEKPQTGSLKLDGSAISNSNTGVSMLFQDLELFPWKRVFQNVAFPLDMAGETPDSINRTVNGLLDLVGLSQKMSVYPAQLSGGQQQRVALIRALAAKPRLLLMDEPFSGLDMETREHLQEEFSLIFRASGVTVIMVTHDINEACFMADRIVLLKPEINGMMLHFDNEAKHGDVSPDRTSKVFHDISDTIRKKMRN